MYIYRERGIEGEINRSRERERVESTERERRRKEKQRGKLGIMVPTGYSAQEKRKMGREEEEER